MRSPAAASRAAAPACADSLLTMLFRGDPGAPKCATARQSAIHQECHITDSQAAVPVTSRVASVSCYSWKLQWQLSITTVLCLSHAAGGPSLLLHECRGAWLEAPDGVARPPAVASESSDAALAPDILLTDCFSPAQPPPPLPDPLLPPPPCCDTGRGLTGPPTACSVVMSCLREDTPHAALTPHEGASASRQP